ncbi:RNA-dependent RNA polymerase [Datura yellow vein nucleorhabdovirus]|uniref:RNA-directed RNA polymerase n=2 Tax=Datura yellow vein nucleorhabdovirus TaxID=195059 RepID=A0A0F7LHN2_9RHAB|nr:RNA-dependent RNA polymerase [Datura yellow vein nucleorhabdovirus]AKH61406.1 RNA-dependent RNA polymerase [Datura yellow vein nucleorhabdovirus]
MEDTHWTSAASWTGDDTDDMLVGEERSNQETAGSYHCKSALRDHQSNMKLFLYKKSFLKLRDLTGADPYTDDVCLLLPDMWNCFFHKSHGLNRIEDYRAARQHTIPYPAVDNWLSHVARNFMNSSIIINTLNQEKTIWKSEMSWLNKFQDADYYSMMGPLESVIKLVGFLNASLVVLNFTPIEERPSIRATLPGVCVSEHDGVFTMAFNEYLSIVICGQAVRVRTPAYDQIMQTDFYLNLCDKINERLNVSIGASLVQKLSIIRGTGNPDECNMTAIVTRIIGWGDRLLYRLKNRAYDLIGKYEAYCVSSILMYDDEEIWMKDEFQRNLLVDDEDNAPDLYLYARELCAELNQLSPIALAEVHGLWRIWGHPIIDLEGGLKKMETTCLKRHNIDTKETKTGERTFKSIFAINYYKKHHHYPLCNMTSRDMMNLYWEHLTERDAEEINRDRVEDVGRCYLFRCIRDNRPIDDRVSGYSHSDWDRIIFYQNFQTPHSVNLATMIKDKAISQTRSELVSSVLTRNSVFDSTKRRGVLKWLSEQTLRLKNYLIGVDTNGLAEDDRIIGLYPKERELKTKARFFSLMSYNMRMYVTATEEILGKYLLPYFPMITMSDTLLSMIIRLFNMTTNIGATDSSVTYSMNIDFSKWNQNMREQTNDLVFQNIDRVVGFRRLISRTHEIFRTSYLYLCSGEYIPAIIRGRLTAVSPYSRIGDESGKEGLRQKGWTITTVCDIVSLAFVHGVAIELIGGGDNQVLTVTIKSSKKNLSLTYSQQRRLIRGRMERFRNALAKKMDKRGLPLKLEETWISHRLLMYNKIMYHDGVPLTSRLKVISRLFSNSNEGIACLGSVCSTLGTGYQSLSTKDYDPVLAWVVSRVFTLLNVAQYHLACPVSGLTRLDKTILSSQTYMREGLSPFGASRRNPTPHSSKRDEVSFTGDKTLDVVDLYLICLYYHKVFGGPGVGSPLSYIMKGFPDPLSEALCFNYMVIRGGSYMSPVTRQKIENMTRVEKAKVKHWEHLLEDPVSVNHDAPSHGIAALREQASEVLKKATIKNRQFKELITLGDKNYLRELSENLCSPPVLEPRLLHDIVGSTIPGYVNTILSKVDQSSTLSKLSTTGGVISNIYESEIKYYLYLTNKIKIGKGHTLSTCPTRDATTLRNTTWGKEIVGVTTPHPAAYLHPISHGDGSLMCDQNYISLLVKRPFKIHELKRGEFRPYFGSYTKEKFKGSILASAYGDEDLIRRALKIQKLLGWRYKQGTYMYKVVQGILSCVTNADPNKFLPTVEEITGDVEHRYHDMATKHGGIPSNLIKHYTHVSCNTSTFINHSKGAANESLHFQAAIIYCSMVGIMSEAHKHKTSRMYHFHESCNVCIQPIIQPEDVERLPHDVSLMACKQNELMYVEEADIPVHFHNVVAFHNNQMKQARLNQKAAPEEMVEFRDKKERTSWLLLAISTLILNKGVKESAIDLIIYMMSKEEIIISLLAFLYVSLIQKNLPLREYDICDIKDIIVENGKVISKLLMSPKIRGLMYEEGIIEGKRKSGEENAMLCLVQDRHHMLCDTLRGAVCKYQDPHYKISKTLMLIVDNPSSLSCKVCSEYVHSTIWAKEDKVCAIHQPSDRDISYHLYSLDKLARFAGPANAPSTKKRKRADGLFSFIKVAKDTTSSRIVKTRLSGFLFRKLPYEENLQNYICGGWSNVRVTSDETEESDRLRHQSLVFPEPPYGTVLPSEEGEVLALVQGIVAVLSLCCGGESHGVISVALEIDINKFSAQTYCKSICMISDTLSQIGDITIRLLFLLDNVTDLERTDNNIISDICYNIRLSGYNTGRLHIIEKGESQMDTSGVLEQSDIAILMNPKVVAYLPETQQRAFVYTNNEKCYEVLTDLESIMDENNVSSKGNILQPLFSSSYPSPAIVMLDKIRFGSTDDGRSFSDSKVRDALDTHQPNLDNVTTNMIVESSAAGGGTSLVYGVYKRYVTLDCGILEESHMVRVMSCLSVGLYDFALRSERGDSMNWKCMLLIKIIISLKIATAEDSTYALKYYSRTVGVSFKRGTCRRILLHKGVPRDGEMGGLVNWTRGSFAQDLPSVLMEVRKWIVINWTSNHKLTRYIDI